MRNTLKRYYGMGHFLTFSCYRRLPLLATVRARSLFIRTLGEVPERYGFLLVGYVVMPQHVHLLVGEPKKGTPSTVLQALKQRVSRVVRGKRRSSSGAQLRLRFSECAPDLPRFWQRRFYDFNVWSAKKRKEKLEYMQRNPIIGLTLCTGSEGARITSRMFFGGWSYPEAPSTGGAGAVSNFDGDAIDCAAVGADIAQATSAPAKRQFKAFWTRISPAHFNASVISASAALSNS